MIFVNFLGVESHQLGHPAKRVQQREKKCPIPDPDPPPFVRSIEQGS
jgi:hypothetical protein